jgi:predicted RNase H-like nuclease
MSDTTKNLKKAWQDAESAAIALQNEKDEAIDKVRAKYGDRLRKANDEAAAAQKKYLDAEAAAALVGRDDAELVASNLGLTLPE